MKLGYKILGPVLIAILLVIRHPELLGIFQTPGIEGTYPMTLNYKNHGKLTLERKHTYRHSKKINWSDFNLEQPFILPMTFGKWESPFFNDTVFLVPNTNISRKKYKVILRNDTAILVDSFNLTR